MRTHQIAAGTIGMCVALLGTFAQGELLIEDTFTGYLDNALISASPAGPALGLTGDWALPTNSDFFVNKTAADENAGTGKAVYDVNSNFNSTRQATRSTSADHVLYTNDGDRFYASFLIDPARTAGQMTFELGLDQLSGAGAVDFAFGIIGGQYTVGSGDGNIAVAGGEVFAGEQRVMVRIEYGDTLTGPDNDELVTLWVDPLDESSTPIIDNVAVDFLNAGGGAVNSITMRGAQMSRAHGFL